jgi:lipopolysaccharide/colanic/teichoic acid biosynthesis glycosyltransferase
VSKRLLDLLVTLLLLPVALPLMAAIALWVRLDSPGPALFRQQRVGRGGRLFRIHKFRTMQQAEGGPQITARVTRASPAPGDGCAPPSSTSCRS